MRRLSKQFYSDLKSGLLAPLGNRVRADHGLCLEIRDDAVNVPAWIPRVSGGRRGDVYPTKKARISAGFGGAGDEI